MSSDHHDELGSAGQPERERLADRLLELAGGAAACEVENRSRRNGYRNLVPDPYLAPIQRSDAVELDPGPLTGIAACDRDVNRAGIVWVRKQPPVIGGGSMTERGMRQARLDGGELSAAMGQDRPEQIHAAM
jgi:hypothetical protein